MQSGSDAKINNTDTGGFRFKSSIGLFSYIYLVKYYTFVHVRKTLNFTSIARKLHIQTYDALENIEIDSRICGNAVFKCRHEFRT
jgi:hypothetical protein